MTGWRVRSTAWAVLGLGLFLYGLSALWLGIDARPPVWDQANHLVKALHCRQQWLTPGWDLWGRVSGVSGSYPPLVHCVTGLFWLVAPANKFTAQLVIHLFLALALCSTYALGRFLWGSEVGLFAALLLGIAPQLLVESKVFMLDLPLTALVALSLLASIRCEGFSNRRWSAALGLAAGAGLLTKWSWPFYVFPALAAALFRGWRSNDRRRRFGNAMIAAVIACLLALPWYLPRIIDLPALLLSRGYKMGAQEGDPAVLSGASFTYYLKALTPQAGPLTVILLVIALVGMIFVRRRGLGLIFVSWLFPLLVFTLLRNKDLRFVMPVLPAVTLLAVSWISPSLLRAGWAKTGIVVLACLQALVVSFGWPAGVAGIQIGGQPLVFVSPPDRSVWPIQESLAAIVRHAGGRSATVSVVPNYPYFSVSNFRYFAVRDGLPVRLLRAWDVYPIGVDYVVLKTGDQGPKFSIEKAERIMERFSDAASIDRVFPVIAEFPLPDGSRGIVRARRIAPVRGMSAERLAQQVIAAAERFLDPYAREREGLTLRLAYSPEQLLAGRIDHVALDARSALVGEFVRKRPPLRLDDLSLTLDGLTINPHRLVAEGVIELLDLERITINHLVITEESLRSFLGSQKGLQGLKFHFEDGAAAGSFFRGGREIEGRLRVIAVPSEDGLLRFEPLEAKVAGVRIPIGIVRWFLGRYLPTGRLSRLPVELRLGTLRVAPGRMEFKGPENASRQGQG